MLSTNNRYVIDSDSETAIPLETPLDLASFIRRLRASAMIRKIKGERGKPRRRPLEDLKKLDRAPLMSMEKEALWIHPIIQLMVFKLMPIWISTKRKKL
jgi:hypothetical protein